MAKVVVLPNSAFCSHLILIFFIGLFLLGSSDSEAYSTRKKELNCQKTLSNYKAIIRIGVVFDSGSQIGKQQMVGMKMALRPFHFSSCSYLKLLLHDSHHSSASSSVLDLITNGGVNAIVGSVRKQDLIVISDQKIPVGIPIVSTSDEQLQPLIKIPSLIQMANNNSITHSIHCIASILTHFQCLPKVTIFYQFTNDSPLSAHRLFNSFLLAGVEVEHYLALSSASNQEIWIEEELEKLMNSQRNRVFIVTQLSLELVDLLLTKARKLNMVGNGYTWIVSHEVFDLISSLDSSSSLLNKMEGVIGFETYLIDTKKSFKRFETKFKKIYKLEYPEEEEPTKASIFAIRAYDAALAITRSMQKLGAENLRSSDELMDKILESNFEGVSGIVKFSKNNGMLISESPKFKIIKVVDQTYKEVAFWTPRLGFVENNFVEIIDKTTRRLVKPNMGNLRKTLGVGDLPRLKTSWSEKIDVHGKKRLKFAVPEEAACKEFVRVSKHLNGNYINGFSINLFRAVMNNINMSDSCYDLVPVKCQYDDMLKAVSNKTYDGAVGDIGILAHRYKYVDFSVSYLETEIVMVVQEKNEKWKSSWVFLGAFQLTMWLLIPTMHLFISFVVWLIERQNNEELKGFGNMLWFSVSVIFYMHREPVKNGMARLVLGPWLFAILVVTTSFTASLTSMMTISSSRPLVLDVDTLKQMDATVGCNTNSFICKYLHETLKFHPTKIKKIDSINEYPKAFENGSIKAAFFISPHARVYMVKNCKGYTKGVSSFKLSGIGFAFQKGSALAVNVSASIVELIETKEIPQLEPSVLAYFNCSSNGKGDGLGLGPEPFVGPFIICGSIASLVLIYLAQQFMRAKLGWTQKPI